MSKNEEIKESYSKQIKSEMKKVNWPSKKELLKYSIATFVFVVLFAVFFFGIESLFAFIKGMIG